VCFSLGSRQQQQQRRGIQLLGCDDRFCRVPLIAFEYSESFYSNLLQICLITIHSIVFYKHLPATSSSEVIVHYGSVLIQTQWLPAAQAPRPTPRTEGKYNDSGSINATELQPTT
jgi:hypothetical protein